MIDCAVILAVGSPMHRTAFASTRPRAMLPAVGKPLVVRAMDRLHREGVKNFTLILGVEEGSVASYLNTAWIPNAHIEFVISSSHDNLGNILPNVAKKIGKPFIVANYNSFAHPQFLKSLLKHHEEYPDHLILTGARSTLSHNKNVYVATMEGQRVTKIAIEDSQTSQGYSLVDLAVCGNDFIKYLSDTSHAQFSRQFMEIANNYIEFGESKITIGETAWTLEIQTDEDLLTLTRQLLGEGQDAHILSELPYTVKVIPPVRIDPQVSVGQGAIIGPNVYLERGSSIGREVTISNSLVLQRGSVPAEKTVDRQIIFNRGSITASS